MNRAMIVNLVIEVNLNKINASMTYWLQRNEVAQGDPSLFEPEPERYQ